MRRDWGQGTKYFDAKRERYVYECRYKTTDGQRKRKKIVAVSKKILAKKIKEWETQIENGIYSPQNDMTISALVPIWLNSIKTSLKINTYNQYAILARKYILHHYGPRKLSTLQTIEIQLWLNNLYQHNIHESYKLSARTINAIRDVWRTMMGFAVDNGFAGHNPVIKVKHIREEKKEPLVLSEIQLLTLLDIARKGNYYPGNDAFAVYLKTEYYVAVNLAAHTGMRRGEVFGLDWRSVYLDNHIITVRYTLLANMQRTSPKTKSSCRNILLDDNTVNLLQTWKTYQQNYAMQYNGIYNNPPGLVFTSVKGTPVSLDNFRQRHWTAMCKDAGILGFGFHGLRHSHATILLKAGVNVKVIAERLGHADVAITMRTYAHVLPTMQLSAVAAIEKINSSIKGNTKKGANSDAVLPDSYSDK